MDQEIYVVDGEKMLKDFIDNAQIALNNIEEKLSFKSASDHKYVKELGKRYRIAYVSYKDGRIAEVAIKPKDLESKDYGKAHDKINEELANLEIYAVGRISDIRNILGRLVAFDDNERELFNKEFYTDKRNDSKIVNEAIEDFLSRFKKCFRYFTLNDNPLDQIIELEIRNEFIEHEKIVSQFKKEIDGDIIKDSFRYIIVYAKTLKILIEVIKRLIEQPGTKIRGRPWDPQEIVVEKVFDEKIRDLERKPLSQYQIELEKIEKTKKDEYLLELNSTVDAKKTEILKTLNSQKDLIIQNLNECQAALIEALNEKKSKLGEEISQEKNGVIVSIKNQEEKSIQELNNLKSKLISDLKQTKDTAIEQFGVEFQKKVIETSRKLEYLERREYEIVENLRTISQFIETHPDLNLSIVEYWKTLLAFAFNLHIEALDTAIPESAKTVWLNGINQTLEALVVVIHDRLAERAMREGSRYQRILTTETDCQKIWHRFVAYIENPQLEDMEYLRRRVAAYAADQALKNVAIPFILYKEGFSEFDSNYRSIDPEKDKGYKEKKSFFKTFFTIAYDEMTERFRGLIMDMVV